MRLINSNSLPRFLALIAALCFVGAASATTKLSLACTPPTTRADGSSLPASEIGSYTFYLDITKINIGTACSYVLPIAQGTCIKKTQVFTVTATDTNGIESARSQGVSVTNDACNPFPPAAPAGLTITIVN